MARITQFVPKTLERNSVHREVEATYTSFELGGKRYFQIDTYGTKDRKIPGKRSQSFQIDREAAARLVELLRKEFSL